MSAKIPMAALKLTEPCPTNTDIYNFFYKQNQKALIKANPKLHHYDITRLLARHWHIVKTKPVLMKAYTAKAIEERGHMNDVILKELSGLFVDETPQVINKPPEVINKPPEVIEIE